jgi:chromosome segregation ATPase
MATNDNRLRRTVTGVINTGNGNSRLDATQAEKKAAEALAKAKEALELASSIPGGNVSELQRQIQELAERLTAEIERSKKQDATHTEQLGNINTDTDLTPIYTQLEKIQQDLEAANKVQIIFEEVPSETLWGDLPSKGDN